MNRVVAFLDACVLYPVSLRDLLVELSAREVFQAKWSSLVRVEVIKNVRRNNPNAVGKLGPMFDKMEAAVPDFQAEPGADTRAAVARTSTHPKDVKIFAAAIDAGCTHLVTFNLRDFDIAYGLGRRVKVMHPDEFLEESISLNTEQSRTGFDTLIGRYKNPPISKVNFCGAIGKNQLPKTAARLLAL